MKRMIGLVAISVLMGATVANMSLTKDFNKNYNVKKGSKIEKAKCSLCHTKGKELNLFGKDLDKNLGKDKKLTPAVYKAVEGLDSDKDGVKNIDEIKKDTLPGDAKSK